MGENEIPPYLQSELMQFENITFSETDEMILSVAYLYATSSMRMNIDEFSHFAFSDRDSALQTLWKLHYAEYIQLSFEPETEKLVIESSTKAHNVLFNNSKGSNRS